MRLYTIDEYAWEIERRILYTGFNKLEHIYQDGIDAVYHKREFDISKFGMVDTFYMLHFVNQAMSPQDLMRISDAMYRISLKNKIWIPRSLGSAVVTIPIFITDASTPDMKQHFTNYNPKHYSAFEFPIMVDLAAQSLFYFRGTPFWGMIYYDGMRSTVRLLLGLEGIYVD